MPKNSVVSFHLKFDNLDITNQDIQFMMGYEEKAEDPIPGLIDKQLEIASGVCEIKAGYVICKVEKVNQAGSMISLIAENSIRQSFNVEKIIYGQLNQAETIAVFVCTAGVELSRTSKQYMAEGDLLSGYILDMIGSVVVEKAMDLVQDNFEKSMHIKGVNITNRYSPGYCNWHVSEQQKLFKLLPKDFCGVSLLPSSLMQPTKSISGFIGIGKNVKKNNYACRKCENDFCIYRNQKKK
jgi:hypothetical protein